MKSIRDRQSGRSRLIKDLSSLLADAGTLWLVESIEAKRTLENGQVQYLIKWANYGPEHNTWEFRENIVETCSTLVEEFEHIPFDIKDKEKYRKHCICQKVYKPQDGAMIQCSCCGEWLHLKCIRMSVEEMNSLKTFYCKDCIENANKRIEYKDDTEIDFYGDSSD